MSDPDSAMGDLFAPEQWAPGAPFTSFAALREYLTAPDPALSTVVTVSPSAGAFPKKLWGMYDVPRAIQEWLLDRDRSDYIPGLYPLYSQLCQMADSAFGTVDFGEGALNLAGIRDVRDVFECAFTLWQRGLLCWRETADGHFWIVLDDFGNPRAISDHQRKTGVVLTYKRRSVRGISLELCWQKYRETGGHCALPADHTIDHVAFSGTMANPVDLWPVTVL